jgi:class 3 adenylate cyclase/predicted ATPase
MTFDEILAQVLDLLQREGRVSYRALKRRFDLDDDYLADLKDEIIEAKQVARDERGLVLVWTGGPEASGHEPTPVETPAAARPVSASTARSAQMEAPLRQPVPNALPPIGPETPAAERRQLTVLFCDLVDSTALASQLDPEELRVVVRAYQDTCARVIARYDGHIAQYLGDGLLVYFGYPLAHEDDAQRAVRSGLGMLDALGQLNTRLEQEHGVRLAIRLGVHTGLVVVGEVGDSTRQEQLALGETPNLAARLQGLAAPNTLVISGATLQLLGGFFASQSLGTPLLKGIARPLEIYQILHESTARSRLDVVSRSGLTPLMGREQEVGLLRARWEQVKDGLGQVVLLGGEAGIGKSRLVQELQAHVATEPQAWLTPCQCSPYHQHSVLYPMIDLLERVTLQFDREESSEQKRSKLEGLLIQYGLPLAETVPLFAPFFSLPLSADAVPLQLSPEQQKQKTLHALLTMLLRIAAQQPVLFVMEDLHWVDPSTLEFLSLLVDQGPTARILVLLTFRPDFSPPWTGRSHLTQVTLSRLTRRQAADMTGRVASGKTLPAEVIEQVVARTDGVPLFVEELTKTMLESGLLQEREERYELSGPLPPLAIPATLHDSLMARLDRLAAVKAMAQLGATLGREFSYALLQAVAPWDAATLQQGLQQLVEAEFLYQRGAPPQATYLFKHALIQEAAYQSLLRSTRQQHHQRIAQVLEERFPDLCATQPELLAQHYTEAGLAAPALAAWQQAGQRALERSAHLEAIAHLSKGLEVLMMLPDTVTRAQQELTLQTALGVSLLATRGFSAVEVERTYARARMLCQHLGEAQQLFPVLWGLWWFYEVRGELQNARELAEQLYRVAQELADPAFLLQAYRAMGQTLLWLGELPQARLYLEQGVALYDPQQHHALAFQYGQDPGVGLRNFLAHVLWYLGYPDQALQRMQEAVALGRQQSHPFSLAFALDNTAWLHHYRREPRLSQEWAEADMALSSEQGFAFFLAHGTFFHGWALACQDQAEVGIAHMLQSLATFRAMGAALTRPHWLALLAEAYRQGGQISEGLSLLAEALVQVQHHGSRLWEPELHRLTGEWLLQQPVVDAQEVETCLRQALDITRRQEAKSLELRAAMSLSRLWQQQGKHTEARELLGPIYGWFTEGFDTADLREARALLAALS